MRHFFITAALAAFLFLQQLAPAVAAYGVDASIITTGTLPVARGGTGATSQTWVDNSTNQTGLAGDKSWTGTHAFTIPTGNSLTITRTAASGAEDGLKVNVSDDATGQAALMNHSATDGKFIAKFRGLSAGTDIAAVVQGRGTTDTVSGTNPLILEDARIGTATAVVNRLLWGVTNAGTLVAWINAVGTLSTTGDVVAATAGYGLKVKEGSNARMGQATLVGGTVTVSNTSVTANTRVYLTRAVAAGTRGFLTVGTITASTSFVIRAEDSAGSLVADTSTVNWLLIEPAP